jgi:hypothetical protein
MSNEVGRVKGDWQWFFTPQLTPMPKAQQHLDGELFT